MPRKRPKMSLSQPVRPRKGDLEQLFATTEDAEQAAGMQLAAIRLDAILPDPLQPRKTFHDERLQELSDSIRQDGVIQPIEVTQIGPDQYMIVHGERRWRAAELAGLQTIPAVVRRRDYNETTRFVRQVVENIQREDLNDVDRAGALIHLRDLMQAELDATLSQHDATHKPWSRKISWAKVGDRLGYSRQRINQLIKLLALPEEVQEAVRLGTMRERDTRILQGLSQSQQRALYRALSAGDISSGEGQKIARFLKEHPDVTVYQAMRVVRQPPAPQRPEPAPPIEVLMDADEAVETAVASSLWDETPSDAVDFEEAVLPLTGPKPTSGPSKIDRLGYIRTHLAQIRLQQHEAYPGERQEILRLLRLIEQDVASLVEAFE